MQDSGSIMYSSINVEGKERLRAGEQVQKALDTYGITCSLMSMGEKVQGKEGQITWMTR